LTAIVSRDCGILDFPITAMSLPDDDEPEIQVAPLAAPIIRRPRTPNPAVDDVIHSGEIAPRSHIVRSSSMDNIPIQRDDPTEPVAAAARLSFADSAPRRRFRIVWLLAAIAPAVAAIALTYVRPSATPATQRTTELEAVAELIGTTLDGEAHAVQARAEAIASSSMLRNGIETDAQTLADMSKDKDLIFPIQAHESLEVFQIRDGARVSMLRLPPTAAAIDPPPRGTARLETRADVLTVVANAPVSTTTAHIGGEIVMAVPVDLGRVKPHIPATANAVTITGLGATIPLGGPAPPPNGQGVTIPIHTTLTTAPLTLTAVLGRASSSDLKWFEVLRYLCGGLALVFLLVFGAGFVIRR
jgi:hypothetical protein